MAVPLDLQPGVLLGGRFRILDELGRGAMAHVYRARDERIGREVALKTLAPTLSDDPAFAERFVREARAVGRLSHPNIVPLFDVGFQDGLPFLVLQLVDGPTLRDVLRRRGALSPAEAVPIVAALAGALQHAHERGVVHGDVKPLNVLLQPTDDGPPRPLLTDFGVARAISETTGVATEEALYGSVPYLAPELLSGQEPAATPAADVYALGVVLYELLAGQTPFTGRTPAEVIAARLGSEPPSLRALAPRVSPGLEAVVMTALAREPAARYPTAAEFHDALATTARAPAAPPAAPFADAPTMRVPVERRAGTPRGTAGDRGGSAGAQPVDPSSAPPRPAAPRRATVEAQRRPFPRWLALAVPLLALLALAFVLWQSLGGQLGGVTVPALAGRKLEDAQAAAQAVGLTLDVSEQPALDTPQGVVISQDPKEGARAAKGSAVKLLVSSGILVPDLAGRQCTEARENLAGQGWTVKPVRWRFANQEDFGKVVAQDPAAGDVVQDKGEIQVQVAGPVAPC